MAAAELKIQRFCLSPWRVNTYLLAEASGGMAVVIDPAGEEERLARICRQRGLTLAYILNTHGHADHCLGNARLAELTGAPTAMHAADAAFCASAAGQEMTRKDLGLEPPPAPSLELADGQVLPLGGLDIAVIHTPGHSPGSVCFHVAGNLFTGDTLFVGAVGRTDLAGADFQTLLDSIAGRLLPLPDETVVWPGHDYGETPTSTLGREKKENPYITDFILEA